MKHLKFADFVGQGVSELPLDVVNILIEKLESAENVLPSHERQEALKAPFLVTLVHDHTVKRHVFPDISLKNLVERVGELPSPLFPPISNDSIHEFANDQLLFGHTTLLKLVIQLNDDGSA